MQKHNAPSTDIARLGDHTIPDDGIPVTPRQAWYIKQRGSWEGYLHWNLARLVEPAEHLIPERVAQVVHQLLQHHDVLRLRLKEDKQNPYHFFASPDEPVPFDYIDLAMVPEQEQRFAIETICEAHQRSLNILYGPVFRVTLFDLGSDQPQRLLIVASHTICDAWSQKILMKDFYKAYTQLRRGEDICLSPKTTSFKEWVERRISYAQSADFQQELAYWQGLPWDTVQPLPVDYPNGREANIRESVRIVKRILNTEDTLFLLRDLPHITQADMIDVQLTALAQAFAQWTKSKTLATFVVNNGRMNTFRGENLFRTVGNIATVPRFLLDIRESEDVWKSFLHIRDQVHRVPKRGLMWEWLPLVMTLDSDIAFNYLGQTHVLNQSNEPDWWRKAQESPGRTDDSKSQHWTLIVCRTWITNNELHVEWSYSANLYRQATIEAVADVFVEILQTLALVARRLCYQSVKRT
jgi:non-ribosomal peptide synthase protein (TIGR01720 family)